jgi:hypothetical protein
MSEKKPVSWVGKFGTTIELPPEKVKNSINDEITSSLRYVFILCDDNIV